MNVPEMKERVQREIDALAGELTAISLDLHAHPELGYQEHHAAQVLSDRLEQAGFR